MIVTDADDVNNSEMAYFGRKRSSQEHLKASPAKDRNTGSPQRNKDILTAEKMYRMIFDAKTQIITDRGNQLLMSHSIDPNDVVIKSQADFEERYKDKDLAQLHFHHYQRRRHKILLRLSKALSEKSKGHAASMMQFANMHLDFNIESAQPSTRPSQMTQLLG